MKQALEKRLIKGLIVSKFIYLNKLQYADDTIMFRQMEVEHALVIKWIFYTIELRSVLGGVNFGKSHIIFMGDLGFVEKI